MKLPMSIPLLSALSLFLVVFPAPVPGQDGAPNLLLNGSFEVAGLPNLEHWQPGDPELATVVSPGSPAGGDWSLRLEADWAPTSGYVTQAVQGVHDGDILELRADVRAEGASGGGAILILSGGNAQSAREKAAATDSEDWTGLAVRDTLELAEGDSVWVRLTSFHTEVIPRVGLFDSVSLTVIPPTPVAPSTWGSLKTRVR